MKIDELEFRTILTHCITNDLSQSSFDALTDVVPTDVEP